jgi:hypothetical protein
MKQNRIENIEKEIEKYKLACLLCIKLPVGRRSYAQLEMSGAMSGPD